MSRGEVMGWVKRLEALEAGFARLKAALATETDEREHGDIDARDDLRKAVDDLEDRIRDLEDRIGEQTNRGPSIARLDERGAD